MENPKVVLKESRGEKFRGRMTHVYRSSVMTMQLGSSPQSVEIIAMNENIDWFTVPDRDKSVQLGFMEPKDKR